MKKINSIICVFLIGLTLIAQLASPSIALADGETTPPPTDTPEVTTTPDPTETPLPVEETSTPVPTDTVEATATPLPTDPIADPVETGTPIPPTDSIEAPTETTPEPADPAPTEEIVEEPTVAEILAEIPAGTDIVVLDQSGDPLPLVTQEAVDAIANSDPMWCPAANTTVTAECVYATTVGLLLPLLAGKDEDGVIYFYTPTTYTTDDVTFDGTDANLVQLADNALNLQGGWDGVTTLGSTIIYSGNSDFSVPTSIKNWTGNVTLKNWTGNVTLDNLTANDNGEFEVSPYVNGILVKTTGSITAKNITANKNNYIGLELYSDGNITLENVTANGNGYYGVYIAKNSTGGTGMMDINMDTVTVNENRSTGVIIRSDGKTTLTNVTVSGNGGDGLNVYTNGNAAIFSINGGAVTNNAAWGLYVHECGSANISTTTIFENNPSGDYHIDCPVVITTPPPVIITARSQGEFDLDCNSQPSFPVDLPNGDLVNIFCPVSGKASIYRTDNTTLPGDLPAGYSYASAFTLEILQEGEPIQVITEGGYVQTSFVAQPLQPGNTYSVLYWDTNTNTWVTLKEFLLDEHGKPRSFLLYPGQDEDPPRKIISGVNVVSRNNGLRVEVTANFPGVFVLAQH